MIFIAGYALLLNFGQRVVPAGPAAFIINTNPIMTAVLAMMILGERFSLTAWPGTALSFAGIGIIALGKGLDVEIGTSVLLILGAAFCNAITTVVQKPLFGRYKPLHVAAWNQAIGGFVLLPFLPGAIAQAHAVLGGQVGGHQSRVEAFNGEVDDADGVGGITEDPVDGDPFN